MSDILPANASQLQRDLDASIGPRQALLDATNTIPGIKYTPPEQLLPWLVWEYGLEPLLPYLNDPRLAIQEGVQWQRIKGTPASLTMALGWLALNDVQIEPETPGIHFHQFQLDSGQIIAGELLEKLRIVSRYSAPLRSRLARIYHGYDVRRLKLDESDYGALLSDYSGIDKDGVVLSFGRAQQALTGITALTEGKQTRTRIAHTKDVYWPTLDNEPLGGIITNSARANVWIHNVTIPQLDWMGHWDGRTWSDAQFPTIALKALRIVIHTHDKNIILASPEIDLSSNLYFTEHTQLPLTKAQMALSIGRSSELNDNQQPALNLANSYRSNRWRSETKPHGTPWLGHWDDRQWNHQAGFTIGHTNNALVTHYYNANTTWQVTSEASLTQHKPHVATANEQITHDVTKCYPLETQANIQHPIDSWRMDNRGKHYFGLTQLWQGRWDERIWQHTHKALVGLRHLGLTVRQQKRALTLKAPTFGGGYTDRIAHALTINNQSQSMRTRISPNAKTDLSLIMPQSITTTRFSSKNLKLEPVGEVWFGYWDLRMWHHKHDYTVAHINHQQIK